VRGVGRRADGDASASASRSRNAPHGALWGRRRTDTRVKPKTYVHTIKLIKEED